jgi:membrane protein
MHTIVAFIEDIWVRAIDRIRRADPLLMGAAIAYNSLFSLVPLGIAFVALLTLFDGTNTVLDDVYAAMAESLPESLAAFLTSILRESVEIVSTERTTILVVSLAIALWSGSRAVYAVQKALRAVEGLVETRGYVRSRLLGILVTVVATAGVLVGYAVFTLGERFWDGVSSTVGLDTALPARVSLGVIAVLLVWALLYAIYRWGPPRPLDHAGVNSAFVAALLVVGSTIALRLSGAIPTTLAVFGTIGVLLVWLYYVGMVVVGAPIILNAIGGAIAERSTR